MVIVNNTTGKFIEVNESFCHAIGLSREALVGHNAASNIWYDPGEMKELVDTIMKTGHVYMKEYRFRKKSGDIHTWLCSADTITIRGETCTLGVATDITVLNG